MNERTRRTRSAAPRPRSNRPAPAVEDVTVEDVSEDVTMAPPGPMPRSLAPYQRRRSPTPDSPYAPAPYYRPEPHAPAPYGGRPALLSEPAGAPWTEAHTLALPFPLWLTLGAPVALALTLALVYVVETTLLGGDWATGGLAVSFTAFALAVVTVGIAIGRVALGRRSFGSVALAGLLALSLVGAGAGGIAQANPLRRAQAQQAESNGDWQVAVNEYTQAGERPPASAELAGVYSAWGESLLRQGDYAGASEKLSTVIQTYPRSGAVVPQARANLFKTYSLWIKSGAITLPFKQSLAFLASYGADPACDSACKQSIVDLTGQAHYQYGEQLVKASQFKQAVAEFELIQSQYAKSTFAAPAHTAAAAAYWALGQQLLTQDCASAVPDYQTLANRYGDSSQGQQAKSALAAPQSVTGTLTGFPSSPTPTLYLSTHVDPAVNAYSHDYKATFDTTNGAFSFTGVKQGSYYLTTYRKISSTQEAFTYYKDTNSGKPYALTVGPLCAAALGSLGY
jgi:TolA-binding protein